MVISRLMKSPTNAIQPPLTEMPPPSATLIGCSFHTGLNLSRSLNEIELASGVTPFGGAEIEADSRNDFIREPARGSKTKRGIGQRE